MTSKGRDILTKLQTAEKAFKRWLEEYKIGYYVGIRAGSNGSADKLILVRVVTTIKYLPAELNDEVWMDEFHAWAETRRRSQFLGFLIAEGSIEKKPEVLHPNSGRPWKSRRSCVPEDLEGSPASQNLDHSDLAIHRHPSPPFQRSIQLSVSTTPHSGSAYSPKSHHPERSATNRPPPASLTFALQASNRSSSSALPSTSSIISPPHPSFASATMVKRNLVVAIIIIILFIVLAIVGYTIYAVQNQVSLFGRRKPVDDEEG
ncbi:hypothetical protein MMC16_001841 [Acarospora aff. strigata]|nr:hypothetical protein [Acarospora aff. strigata]